MLGNIKEPVVCHGSNFSERTPGHQTAYGSTAHMHTAVIHQKVWAVKKILFGLNNLLKMYDFYKIHKISTALPKNFFSFHKWGINMAIFYTSRCNV